MGWYSRSLMVRC